jgi:hypothetical protein
MTPEGYEALGYRTDYLASLNLTKEQAVTIIAAAKQDDPKCVHAMIWEVVDDVPVVKRWDERGERLSNYRAVRS